MAYPTAVNNQITDSLTNGVEATPATLPEKIMEMSRAFTQTLEMENTVFQSQLNGIVNMVLTAMQKVAELNENAAASEAVKTELKNLAEHLKTQVTDGVAMATKAHAAPVTNPNEQTLESALVLSVSESYKNAVAAQQQMYIIMQAATTQTIATILSVDVSVITQNTKAHAQK